jgi:hypothetical protein
MIARVHERARGTDSPAAAKLRQWTNLELSAPAEIDALELCTLGDFNGNSYDILV